MLYTKGHLANANIANGKCISGVDQNCSSKINNCSDRDAGCPDTYQMSLWIKSRVFDDFMSFPSENLIFSGWKKWSGSLTCSARFSPTKRHHLVEWKWREPWERWQSEELKLGTVRWWEGGISNNWEKKKSAWICGLSLQNAGWQWLENLSKVKFCLCKFFQQWRPWRSNQRNQCG